MGIVKRIEDVAEQLKALKISSVKKGDLGLPLWKPYSVLGISMFQNGIRTQARLHIRASSERGGKLAEARVVKHPKHGLVALFEIPRVGRVWVQVPGFEDYT